ncbi:prepilin-type N-terminal cleavage/methylation domain-containing protein [Anaerotalea alkaliphila]|uniref:Prepilin-type N-terminal cleavage/methylation domain-containing protein n=1 Tax=Anaerotalea alkaliphila TaxID=2662126 RepID=A0A7X5HX47_9FIRM|nr:prepilin-type N-terminal cleavage/methylation domain-containing protein [Anaerotalea alkaliphila]NDL68235.1 prepilin-type N-terminal cleavage/methylation domain-containing protein [Anaerotalea alkaliphila]
MRFIKSESGLTLVEVIISVAIIGIIAVSFLNMFSFSFDSIYSMGRKTEATRIAQGYMDLYYENEPVYNKLSDIADEVMAADGVPIQYTVSSPIVIGPNTDGLYSVTITVFYRDGTRSVSLTALVP